MADRPAHARYCCRCRWRIMQWCRPKRGCDDLIRSLLPLHRSSASLLLDFVAVGAATYTLPHWFLCVWKMIVNKSIAQATTAARRTVCKNSVRHGSLVHYVRSSVCHSRGLRQKRLNRLTWGLEDTSSSHRLHFITESGSLQNNIMFIITIN